MAKTLLLQIPVGGFWVALLLPLEELEAAWLEVQSGSLEAKELRPQAAFLDSLPEEVLRELEGLDSVALLDQDRAERLRSAVKGANLRAVLVGEEEPFLIAEGFWGGGKTAVPLGEFLPLGKRREG